jgi:hypothetical protein
MSLDLYNFSFRRQVRALHRLGERALADLLIASERNPKSIPELIAEFAAIDPDALHVAGGYEFPVILVAAPSGIGDGGRQ